MAMKSCCLIFAILVGVISIVYRKFLVDLSGYAMISYRGIQELRAMPSEEIDDFFKAYEVLEKMGTDGKYGVQTPEDAKALHDYYRVLHRILAVGVVLEVMMLPPTLDPQVGVLGNLQLFFTRMSEFLNVQPGQRVLEFGSGRGKIAQFMHNKKGVKVVQVNIDETQLSHSKLLAQEAGNEEFMEFINQDYNEPFPMVKDGSLDAVYCAQACAFVANKTKFLQEEYRMLKPGGMVYHLEWLRKDKSEFNSSTIAKYDSNNKTHFELVRQAGVLVGGAFPSGILEWERAFKEAGFHLIHSREPAAFHALYLMNDADRFYKPVHVACRFLADWGIIGPRLAQLFDRLRTYVEAAFTAMNLELCTLTYEFVAQKI
jgi:cyclopropane fatty-acyl-phospholipid synthase-like methyltransferase